MKLSTRPTVRFATFTTYQPLTHCRHQLPLTTNSRHTSNIAPNESQTQHNKADTVSQGNIAQLQHFIDLHSGIKLLALTGAGISTESGIPDYRSPGVGLYNRTEGSYRPMTVATFLGSDSARQRYWARSYLAWKSTMFGALPNGGHLALAGWQRSGGLGPIVTQNVDHLHQKAGSNSVIELHGSLYAVRCLSCNRRSARTLMQRRLEELNADLLGESEELLEMVSQFGGQQDSSTRLLARPDGDIDLSRAENFVKSFRVPSCEHCQGQKGILKPDIVFFGENVPRPVVDKIGKLVDGCSGLLVLGSSLAVFSSYRFVLQAIRLQKPVLVVNIGPTRADKDGVARLDAKLGHLLPKIQVKNCR